MSFARQWFPPYFNVCFEKTAIDFSRNLNKHNFTNCREILESKINISDEHKYWERQLCRLNRITNRQNLNSVYLSFINFWPDFEPSKNQLLDFLQISCPNISFIITNDLSLSDIVIFSCYGDNTQFFKYTRHADRWIFLGENVRPEYFNYDFSISFDQSNYVDKNVHLPLWMLEIDFFNKNYSDRLPFNLDILCKPKIWDYAPRRNSAVFVGNNAEPLRESLIYKLTDYGINVERFGSHTKPLQDKIAKYQEFKIVIACENSFSPGYMTEKLIHAHLSGAHIIYAGDNRATPELEVDSDHIYHLEPPFDLENNDLINFTKNAFREKEKIIIPKLCTKSCISTKFGEVVSGFGDITRHLRSIL